MSNDLKKIEMYQCRWCSKVFYTTKHNCKFSIHKKNCFSCMHLIGIKETINSNYAEFGDFKEKTLLCDAGHDTPMIELSNKKWDLNCSSWCCIQDYEGKSTFLYRMLQANLSRDDNMGMKGDK